MQETGNASDAATYERVNVDASYDASNGVEKEPLEADLRRVMEAWPRLPEAIKAGIRAMVESASAVGG